MTSPVV